LSKDVKYSHTELLEGVVKQDVGILNYIFSEYYSSIRHFILQNKGNEEDAKDVFQEVMIVLYRKLKETNFELTSSLKTYLYAIARLIWLKELSKRKTYINIEDTNDDYQDDNQGILDTIERNDRFRLYRSKFRELSKDCQRILSMYINEVSIREITLAMGYKSEQHTKNRHYRCKKSLIKRIRESKSYKEVGNG